jgi:hypothetical protein
MSCRIVDISQHFELIPNGSPNFLTKATRQAWKKSELYTSWVANKDDVEIPEEKSMFSYKARPLHLFKKPLSHENKQLKKDEEEHPAKKRKKNDKDVYIKHESTTMQWWNSLGTLSCKPQSDKIQVSPELEPTGETHGNPRELETRELDTRGTHSNPCELDTRELDTRELDTRGTHRNQLPVPKTILGAFRGNAVLVRLRSVVDADLLVSADDVSLHSCLQRM